MSTVSLQMIIKDEYEEANSLVTRGLEVFDAVNLTVSHKPTANKLRKAFEGVAKVTVKWREWTDRFDEARNANFALCKTDYAFWLDADDDFDFRAIPKLVDIADGEGVDAIFLPYNYAQDEQGNCITRHWRERLVRMDVGFEWRGWVHESLISDKPYNRKDVNQEVVHHTSPGHAKESVGRNHDILVKAAEATLDPRYIHYLGMSYFTMGDYEQSIETLLDYIEVGGSADDIYRSMNLISEASYYLKNVKDAIDYALQAAALIPEYPMAYWLLAQFEADQDNFAEGLEWIRVSESKPDPQTHTIWDPTSRERATLIGARCLYMLGQYNEALAYLRKIPQNKSAQEIYPDFLAAADEETFVKVLPKMRKYFSSDEALYRSLNRDMQLDNRLRALRNIATKPQTWADNSIVIFCGQGYEEWGPHTTDKGMGGSEEAIVYLSRALAEKGYRVTVYGEVPHEIWDHEWKPKNGLMFPEYRPWKEMDPRDQFNVFVAWRAPAFTEQINAKVKIVDVHDIIPQDAVKDYDDTTYFVKSNYHRELYPKLADGKFRVIGNGIVKEQFNG